jgi:hypothetical protein
MLYKILGMAVWHGGKLFLRRRYGFTYAPKPLVAGLAAGIAGGIGLLAARRARRRDGA